MEKLRVCLFATEFLPNWGGVGTYCIELARTLADKVELHVVTLGRTTGKRLVYTREDIEDFLDGKIEAHLIGTSPIDDTFFYNARMQFALLKSFPRMEKEYHFALIHSNSPQMADLLLKTGRKISVPSITTIHTILKGHKEGIVSSGQSFLKMDLSEKCTLLMYPGLRMCEELYLRRSKEFITPSNWMRGVIERNYPYVSRMHVIHNGVDSEKFTPKKATNSEILEGVDVPIVLFSSRLTVAKGVHFLIRAIPRILTRTREVHFVFSGAGPKESWLGLLKKLNVEPSFYTFLGYVDYRLLPALYARADVFVAPSLYENLPIRILEAMSCGSAVVASNICAIPEVITHGKNGMLIAPGNVDDLANTTAGLLQDDGLRIRLGKNARETVVKDFAWNVIGEKTLDVYKQLLQSC
jgi:glycosyltransferase involved in cell wall biosynthesis